MNYESNMNQLQDLIRYAHILSCCDEQINGSFVRVYHFYKQIPSRPEYKAVMVNGKCVLCEAIKEENIV